MVWARREWRRRRRAKRPRSRSVSRRGRAFEFAPRKGCEEQDCPERLSCRLLLRPADSCLAGSLSMAGASSPWALQSVRFCGIRMVPGCWMKTPPRSEGLCRTVSCMVHWLKGNRHADTVHALRDWYGVNWSLLHPIKVRTVPGTVYGSSLPFVCAILVKRCLPSAVIVLVSSLLALTPFQITQRCNRYRCAG